MLFHPKLIPQINLNSQNELKIHIQTKYNRKRLRKRGRKHHKRIKEFKEVLYAIFEKYQIIDHIAPAEIDPYWTWIYKYYEIIKFIKLYLVKSIIFDDKIIFWDNCNEIKEILTFLYNIENQLYNYLCGYFELLVRLTLKKRFWGWGFYFDELFYPEMWTTCIELLKSLSFDCDRAKPSVYFVNSCWFKGLQISKEILEKLKKEKQVYFDYNKGRIVFNEEELSKSEIDINDKTFEECLEDINTVDLLEELKNYFKSEKSIYEDSIQYYDKLIENEKNIKSKNNEEITFKTNEILYTKSIEDQIIENEKITNVNKILTKIMHYFNLTSLEEVYKNLSYIKENIKNIKFSEEEKEIIKLILSS